MISKNSRADRPPRAVARKWRTAASVRAFGSAQPSCGKFFHFWQKILEKDGGWWAIRTVVAGVLWLNRGMRTMLDQPAIQTWPGDLWSAGDALLLENGHSTVLKFNTVDTAEVSVQGIALSAAFTAQHCRGCKRRCGLIIGNFAIVPPDDDGGPSSVQPAPPVSSNSGSL
jgi:hypothetical protein